MDRKFPDFSLARRVAQERAAHRTARQGLADTARLAPRLEVAVRLSKLQRDLRRFEDSALVKKLCVVSDASWWQKLLLDVSVGAASIFDDAIALRRSQIRRLLDQDGPELIAQAEAVATSIEAVPLGVENLAPPADEPEPVETTATSSEGGGSPWG